MGQAVFRLYAGLNDLVRSSAENGLTIVEIAGHETVKHLIEALGIPHTEIELILVNGSSAGIDYIVQVGDRVAVYPHFSTFELEQFPDGDQAVFKKPQFVLDVHLGRLAELLRMLGFDCRYQNDYDDLQLVQISKTENRILLTRDRGLLKRKAVTSGYLIRSKIPEQQAVEVIRRYQLISDINLLSRCAKCGGLLKTVSKEEVNNQLEPITRAHYQNFQQCESCQQIFWKGSHYSQLDDMLQGIISRARGEYNQGYHIK